MYTQRTKEPSEYMLISPGQAAVSGKEQIILSISTFSKCAWTTQRERQFTEKL